MERQKRMCNGDSTHRYTKHSSIHPYLFGGRVSVGVVAIAYIVIAEALALTASEMERAQGLVFILITFTLLTALLVYILPSKKEIPHVR